MTSNTADAIAADLRGELYDPGRIQKINGCGRCQAKNHRRRCANGISPVDDASTFDDGDDVLINAVRRDDLWDKTHWVASGVHHRHHPQRPFADGVVHGTDQARAHARIHITDENKYIVDIDVVDVSPSDDGPQTSPIQRDRQQFVDDQSDSHPDQVNVLDRGPSEPPAHWPDVEREWLRQLQADHGPLEIPHTHLGISRVDDMSGHTDPGSSGGRSP